MVVGIHQPNYIPGISYFCKILYSDIFILLDSVQFSKGNWTNRNRIKSAGGELMLTVPIKTGGKGFQAISEIEISNRTDWGKKHLRSLQQNYRKSAYFQEFMPLLEEIYDREWTRLSELNIHIIKRICAVLDLKTEFLVSSAMGQENLKSTDLLAALCRDVGGDVYLSGAGGRKYMELEKFSRNGLQVRFMEFQAAPYRQQFGEFIPNLSMVDLLFNEGTGARQILQESARVGQ